MHLANGQKTLVQRLGCPMGLRKPLEQASVKIGGNCSLAFSSGHQAAYVAGSTPEARA